MSSGSQAWNDQLAAPSAFGAEFGGGEPVAYVPSQRGSLSDEQVTLELRHTVDGRLVMLAYTSLDFLVAGCGEAQPWVAAPAERVSELQRLSGAETVLWDVALFPDQRRDG
ncbi:MAG: hypothetical protein LC799_24575 [Actinobacteria bacterium]|nr:hypothetical protein [Actinomycetota bacterium]